MKWEFTSWGMKSIITCTILLIFYHFDYLVPLVSRMCPSDTYKIYKSKSSVRIDTTLVGFDQASNWQRGNRSFIFSGKGIPDLKFELLK